MPLVARAWPVAASLCLAATSLPAQHAHGTADSVAARAHRGTYAIGAQAALSGTRLTNAIDGRTRSEGYVSQPAIMGHAALASGRVSLTGTLNLEGLTLGRGELLGGVYGEGYVDRRHPHTLLHEAMAAVQGTVPGWGGAIRASLAAGKGFAPFGTDDPMMRPFERYPVNHHLAQILERAVAVGAVAVGPARAPHAPQALLELAAFNGDEPTGPWAWPRLSRFGDSWSARLSLHAFGGAAAGWPADGLELSGSAAGVRAPESPDGGGLDQRKWSAAARWAAGAPLGVQGAGDGTYVLVEWARTDWQRNGQPVALPGYRDGSALAEAGARRRGIEVVARAEVTDRLEEERLVDPFRALRPATDVAALGATRWRVLTIGLAHPASFGRGAAAVRAAPFVEVSSLVPRAVVPRAVFEPASFYGGRRLWAVTAGLRIGVGRPHSRMGRYGVAGASHTAHVAQTMPSMMGMP